MASLRCPYISPSHPLWRAADKATKPATRWARWREYESSGRTPRAIYTCRCLGFFTPSDDKQRFEVRTLCFLFDLRYPCLEATRTGKKHRRIVLGTKQAVFRSRESGRKRKEPTTGCEFTLSWRTNCSSETLLCGGGRVQGVSFVYA